MASTTKQLPILLGLILIVLGVSMFKQYMDNTNPKRAMEKFEKSLENGDWHQLNQLIASDYYDIWGHDREYVVEGLKKALQGFFHLDIDFQNPRWHPDLEDREYKGLPKISNAKFMPFETRVKFVGKGNPFASYAMTEANRITGPFTFYWRKKNSLFAKWELAGLNHPNWTPPRQYQ